MKTDRELLELAARAAGLKLSNGRDVTGMHPSMNIYAAPFWNPLTDDGDAFRLAVKLKIDITNQLESAECYSCFYDSSGGIASEKISGCPLAATRRAIVRAAAAIGEKL